MCDHCFVSNRFDSLLGVPYAVPALTLGGMLCALLWAMERLYPWRTEVLVSMCF